MVEVFLPLGDIAADPLRELALACRRYVNDTIRATASQNLLIRWVTNSDLGALYQDLKRIGLAEVGLIDWQTSPCVPERTPASWVSRRPGASPAG